MAQFFVDTWKLESCTAHIDQLTEDVEVCSGEVVDGLLDEGTDVSSTACCVKKEFETLHGQLAAQIIEESPSMLLGHCRSEDHVFPRNGQTLKSI